MVFFLKERKNAVTTRDVQTVSGVKLLVTLNLNFFLYDIHRNMYLLF